MTFYCLLCPANFKDLPLLLDHAEEHNQKAQDLRAPVRKDIAWHSSPRKLIIVRRRPHGYRTNRN